MSMQLRNPNGGDNRAYAPYRDVAHNFRFVVTEVAERLTDHRWKELHAVVLPEPTPEQLGQASQAFITFVVSATQDKNEKMYDALKRSGWFDCHPSAQAIYMATLGAVMSGIYFNGAREATLGGEGPCSDVAGVVRAGREFHQLISAPRWKRPWLKLKNKLAKARDAFKQ